MGQHTYDIYKNYDRIDVRYESAGGLDLLFEIYRYKHHTPKYAVKFYKNGEYDDFGSFEKMKDVDKFIDKTLKRWK